MLISSEIFFYKPLHLYQSYRIDRNLVEGPPIEMPILISAVGNWKSSVNMKGKSTTFSDLFFIIMSLQTSYKCAFFEICGVFVRSKCCCKHATVQVCCRLQSCMADFRMVSPFFIAFFSDFDRIGFVEIKFVSEWLPHFSKFQFSKE